MMVRGQMGFSSFNDSCNRFINGLFLSRQCSAPPFTPEEWESFYRGAVCEGLAPFVYLKLRDAVVWLGAGKRWRHAVLPFIPWGVPI